MKLIDIVQKASEIGDVTVCARRPWTANSEVCLVSIGPMAKIPEHTIHEGYEYFLEADVVREVLEPPRAVGCSERRKLELVIHYAENDAYPAWIFD